MKTLAGKTFFRITLVLLAIGLLLCMAGILSLPARAESPCGPREPEVSLLTISGTTRRPHADFRLTVFWWDEESGVWSVVYLVESEVMRFRCLAPNLYYFHEVVVIHQPGKYQVEKKWTSTQETSPNFLIKTGGYHHIFF